MRLATSTALLVCLAAQAQAETAGARYAAWQICLDEAFAIRAARSSPTLAADAAMRECRASESAYLAALSTSPLLDAQDVAYARPALVVRARGRMLAGRTRNL